MDLVNSGEKLAENFKIETDKHDFSGGCQSNVNSLVNVSHVRGYL
jgi:hypothetical protein